MVQHVFKRNDEGKGNHAATKIAMHRFLRGDDDFKNERLKLILHVVEAPFSVLSTIRGLGGERPVLIGKRLTTQYFWGKNYFEVDMDVGSSMIASSINSVINAASKNCILDYAWLIEAQNEDELPECVLVKLRGNYCDPPALFVRLDASGERVE